MGEKPRRTCLGCRATLQKDALIRYALSPEGQVLADYRQKLPGRGAYTCINPECLGEAIRRGQFERVFRGRCERPEFDSLRTSLLNQFEGRILNLLGMARKAGQVVAGSNQVLMSLDRTAEFDVILLARDISPGVAEKVEAKAARCNVLCRRIGTKTILGQHVGREQRSVIGLQSGSLAGALKTEIIRYEEFAGEH